MKDFCVWIVVLAIACGIVALSAWLVMLLWNFVMPAIFGLPEISFWVSLGLCALISLLFGGGSKNGKD